MQRFYENEELVERYEVFRPEYPDELVTEILKFLDEQNPGEKPRGFMLDVGCGGGRATKMFAPHFEKVLGIDVSESQINMAKKTVPDIEFKIGSASELPAESGSVDLIIAGTAAHYFDFNVFVSECDRVLRPGGCVALFTYMPCKLKTLQGEIIEGSTGETGIYSLEQKYSEDIGTSPYVMSTFIQRYKPIYDRINKACKKLIRGVELDIQFTEQKFASYLATLGQYHSNKDSFGGTDPLVTARKHFEKLLDNSPAKESSFKITYEYPVVLFRK